MGKIEEKKFQKLNALLKSSYELFITKGISQTSIHDIVQKAGVAKGTFYLYFKDKYEIRDRLVVKTAERLFLKGYQELQKEKFAEEDAAKMFEENGGSLGSIGQRNIESVRMVLRKEGIRLLKEDVGGGVARTLLFDVGSGLGCVRSYGRQELII